MTHSDCIAYLRTLPDASVDSCVTDPPYELGFMGKKWDNSGIAYSVELWREVLRALKPGAHLLAFGGTRTHHRMVCAIEDAGFEIRDEMQWLYGSGFPKSLDVSKAVEKVDAVEARRTRQLRFTEWMRGTGLTQSRIDELTGTNMGGHYLTSASQPAVATRELFETLRPHFTCVVPDWIEKLVDERTVESENFKRREVVGKHPEGSSPGGFGEHRFTFNSQDITAPATAAAKQWDGWGTALKPACEPICVARKPLCGTVAANVLAHGTGAINVDGCRVEFGDGPKGTWGATQNTTSPFIANTGTPTVEHSKGRWPANVILSHAEGCVCTGTKRVKGQADRGLEQTQARSWKNSSTAGINRTGHADADGLETVEAWQCVEGCPVRLLDAQSGESKSTTGVRAPNGTMGYHGGASGLPGIVSGHSDTGGASRFFKTFSPEKLCPLCCLPYAKECETVVASWKQKLAQSAANHSLTFQATDVFIARTSALAAQGSDYVLAVKSAANLCDSCAMSIAAALVAIRHSDFKKEPLALILDSIGDSKSFTQIQNLVPFVRALEGTDTTLIIQSLSKLFGCAFHATEDSTRQDEKEKEADGSGPEKETRFLYTAKSSRSDREHFNTHATVKPLALMRYLVRLVTPPGGVVLDMFAGSGTTLVAARQEGFRFLGCDADEGHVRIAQDRLALELPFET